MKHVLLVVGLATTMGMFAAPQRMPIYEPDGKPSAGQPVKGQNLFLNAKVTATGQWDRFAPNFAVDGKRDVNNYWAAENLPQSLTVDMGKPKKLSNILLVPYWSDGRVYKFKIEGSVDGKTWKELSDQSANSICAGDPGFHLSFDPVEVRYVRTVFLSNSKGAKCGAHIIEIEGYAEGDGSVQSFFLAGDIYTRYDRDVLTSPKSLAPVVKLTGWRGERVSAMLVASSPSGFGELRLSTADKVARLDVLRYTLGKDTLYGDILDGTEQTTFKGVTRPVIYTRDIPADAKGVLRDTVTAVINGKTFTLPVEITVVDRLLPASKDWKFHLDLWQHPDAVARWHAVPYGSDEHFHFLTKYHRALADMGQKTITVALIDEPWHHQTYDDYRSGIVPTKRADGSWAYDYRLFDKLVENALAAGLGPQIDCYSMLTWSLKFRYFDEKANKFVAPMMSPGSEAYEDFWGHLLADFSKHLKAKGWFEQTKIAMDERPDNQIGPALAVLRKHAPGFGLVAATNRRTDLSDSMYDVSPSYGTCRPFLAVAAERRRQGKWTTFYTCCGPARPNTFLFSAPAEAEWLPLFAAAMGLDGYLRWAWCSWVKDPFESQDFTAWPTGDTSLVYPGPRLSLRALLMRDGIETFEKLKILGTRPKELDIFTIERGGQKGVHSADVKALNAAVNR